MKVGVDTNVLFYALNKETPFHQEARENLALLVEKGQAVIAQQNLVELAVTLTKRGITPQEASGYAKYFIEIMPIVRPTVKTLALFLDCIDNLPLRGVKLFDLYLALTFISNGVDYLYTYNKKDFQDIEGLKFWPPS